MPSTSTASLQYGQASGKPGHPDTTEPPTAQTDDQKKLRESRISSFVKDPHSPPIASSQGPKEIKAAHLERVKRELDAIMTRLGS